jgi:hypothetical protein
LRLHADAGMSERRDLGFTLVVAAGLLFGAGYLPQCSSATRQTESVTNGAPTAARAAATAATQREADEEREPAHRHSDESQEEERAKIRNVAHALQTIAASPELRATVGLPR